MISEFVRIKEWRPDRTLLRFLLVGASNTVVSYTVFHLSLRDLVQSAAVAQALSYSAGILWSFLWNRRWTFRHQGAVLPSLLAFTALQLALLVASSLLVGLAVDRLMLPPTPSWLVVMAFITVLNYAASRHLVFTDQASSAS